MAEQITGVVKKVFSKDRNVKGKVKQAYTLIIDDGSGEDKFIGNGFVPPHCSEGDTVEIDIKMNGSWMNVGALKVLSAGAAPAASSPARSSGGGGGRGAFPIPALDGQRSIIRQNAVTNARGILDASGVDAIKEGTTPDEAVELIIKVARQIEAYTAGDLDAELAEEMANDD